MAHHQKLKSVGRQSVSRYRWPRESRLNRKDRRNRGEGLWILADTISISTQLARTSLGYFCAAPPGRRRGASVFSAQLGWSSFTIKVPGYGSEAVHNTFSQRTTGSVKLREPSRQRREVSRRSNTPYLRAFPIAYQGRIYPLPVVGISGSTPRVVVATILGSNRIGRRTSMDGKLLSNRLSQILLQQTLPHPRQPSCPA
jgi:hypothetical protein